MWKERKNEGTRTKKKKEKELTNNNRMLRREPLSSLVGGTCPGTGTSTHLSSKQPSVLFLFLLSYFFLLLIPFFFFFFFFFFFLEDKVTERVKMIPKQVLSSHSPLFEKALTSLSSPPLSLPLPLPLFFFFLFLFLFSFLKPGAFLKLAGDKKMMESFEFNWEDWDKVYVDNCMNFDREIEVVGQPFVFFFNFHFYFARFFSSLVHSFDFPCFSPSFTPLVLSLHRLPRKGFGKIMPLMSM